MTGQKHGTAIEWTQRPGTRGETWNPVRARNRATGGIGHFCIHASAGCANCYAERLQPRFNNPVRFAAQDAAKVEVFLDEAVLVKPLHWKSPRTIFVCSMTDLFGLFVKDEWIDKMFAIAALCPQHTFIMLTKRTARMKDWLGKRHSQNEVELAAESIQPQSGTPFAPKHSIAWPLPNVWLGVSAEDQKTADERIPNLLATPAAVRFVSYEPALGPVDFGFLEPCDHTRRSCHEVRCWRALDWIIAGGESGPNAHPSHPDWFRSARDQCQAAGVPFFFKQWGEFLPHDHGGGHIKHGFDKRSYWVGDAWTWRIGKKRAGRLLDGRAWNEYPEAR